MSNPTIETLHTLPHTGLRVPDTGVHMRNVRTLDTDDGYAWTADLYRGKRRLGTAQNHGDGGESTWRPVNLRPADVEAEVAEFVAASRDEHGEEVDADFVLGSLVDEAIIAKKVDRLVQRGKVAIRVMHAIIAGGGDEPERVDTLVPGAFYGLDKRHIADEVALVRSLRKAVPDAHQFQLFVDNRWKPLDEGTG